MEGAVVQTGRNCSNTLQIDYMVSDIWVGMLSLDQRNLGGDAQSGPVELGWGCSIWTRGTWVGMNAQSGPEGTWVGIVWNLGGVAPQA